MTSLAHLACLRPFLREQDLVEGQIYVITEPKKIMLDRGDKFCYVASVNGERRLNMSLRTSISMDRVARVMDLSSNEMLFMQLKMRAVKIGTVPDGLPNAYNGLQLVVEDVANIAVRDTMMGLREEKEQKSVVLTGYDLNCVQALAPGVGASGSGVQASGSGAQISDSGAQSSGSGSQALGSDEGASGSVVQASGSDVKTSTLL